MRVYQFRHIRERARVLVAQGCETGSERLAFYGSPERAAGMATDRSLGGVGRWRGRMLSRVEMTPEEARWLAMDTIANAHGYKLSKLGRERWPGYWAVKMLPGTAGDLSTIPADHWTEFGSVGGVEAFIHGLDHTFTLEDAGD